MICPYCMSEETKVTDKRDSGDITRRRRECLKCGKRFSTQERVEEIEIRVVKKDGRKEDFDRGKLKRGVLLACEKRPIDNAKIDNMITKIEEKLRKKGKEVKSEFIGELISRELKKVDDVAYIRFASVYKGFSDIGDFKEEIKELVK